MYHFIQNAYVLVHEWRKRKRIYESFGRGGSYKAPAKNIASRVSWAFNIYDLTNWRLLRAKYPYVFSFL